MFDRSDRNGNSEEGFTLIELLIAIVLSGILIGAITTGFIASMNGTASAHDRFVASNGAHTLSTYFTADVQSASPDLVSTSLSATLGCASEPTGTTNVLRLQWSEMTTATEFRAFSVSYRIVASDSNGDSVNDTWKLVRYSCSASQNPFSTTMATVLSGATLKSDIVIDDLHEPTGSYVTAATVTSLTRDVSLLAYSALGKGETTPYSYTYSATMRMPKPAPYVTSIARNAAASTNASTVGWTVTFSESVTGVDASDFTFVYSGGLSGAVAAAPAGSGTTWTVTAGSYTGQGTLALKVDDNDSIRSSADNDPLGGTGNDNGDYTGGAYTIDRLAPSVVVAQSSGQADPATTLPILFTATFNETVTGFDASDVSYSGTAPAGATISVTGSVKDYVISFTSVPGTGARTIIPSIAANTASDAAGNGNSASTNGSDNQVTYNTSGPTTSITNVQLVNGGTLGTLDKDDQLIITFADAMKVDTFCSTWSNDTNNQSISGNSDVTVTVTDGGAGTDVLTVTASPVCSFTLGSVDLGSSGWVSATRTFGGSTGSTKSRIDWTVSSRTLKVTLGAPSTGTMPTGVTASTPVYTANSNLRSSTSGVITNSPFTAPAATRF